eukprot:766643-Hanusia_phi.AAC.1
MSRSQYGRRVQLLLSRPPAVRTLCKFIVNETRSAECLESRWGKQGREPRERGRDQGKRQGEGGKWAGRKEEQRVEQGGSSRPLQQACAVKLGLEQADVAPAEIVERQLEVHDARQRDAEETRLSEKREDEEQNEQRQKILPRRHDTRFHTLHVNT